MSEAKCEAVGWFVVGDAVVVGAFFAVQICFLIRKGLHSGIVVLDRLFVRAALVGLAFVWMGGGAPARRRRRVPGAGAQLPVDVVLGIITLVLMWRASVVSVFVDDVLVPVPRLCVFCLWCVAVVDLAVQSVRAPVLFCSLVRVEFPGWCSCGGILSP